MSAARMSSAARTRLRTTRESMSGASRSARPRGTLTAVSTRRAPSPSPPRAARSSSPSGSGVCPGGSQDPGELRQVPVLRRTSGGRRGGRRAPGSGWWAAAPGLADPAPHQGVDQGGLPGPGGPADHGEQRCLGVLEARQEVVVELGEEFGPGLPGAFSPRQGQWETHGGDTVAQGGKCVDELGPYVHGRHMRRMPNFEAFLKRMGLPARRFHPLRQTPDREGGGGRGITTAQHPARGGRKPMQESHLPAIIGSLH
ncbi:hypothetical protein SCALM49S_03401 [Streptomyces californicus]